MITIPITQPITKKLNSFFLFSLCCVTEGLYQMKTSNILKDFYFSDGKHVVFGIVKKGYGIITDIEVKLFYKFHIILI